MKAKRNRRRPLWIVCIAILLLAAAAIIAVKAATAQRFQLSENTVTLEAGTAFVPEDYITALKNANIADVKISGDVAAAIPGTYTVTYSLGSKVKTLTVHVADTTPPGLSYQGETDTVILIQGEELNLRDFLLVSDATEVTLRLDTQGQSLSEPGTYSVAAEAVDAAGNKSSIPLQIEVRSPDTEPPVIQGAGGISVIKGSSFDPKAGVSVTDNTDPSPVLEIDSGKLDLSKAGTYTVTYTARDASGNEAVVQRKVTVTEPEPGTVMFTPKGGTYGWNAAGIADQPYLVAVNRACCTTTVYGKDSSGNYTVPVKAIVCSVGKEGHETPTGRFTTSDRHDWCYMVDGSYGRYAIRIRRGIMFHSVCYFSSSKSDLEYEEYNKLGTPASLGCIRMSVADEKWLYDNCPTGFPVVIYDDTALPGPLGKPDPIRIDTQNEALRCWDPTDWDSSSPWNNS